MWKLLRIELFKIFKRPRTYIAFGAIAAVVILFQVGMKFDGKTYVLTKEKSASGTPVYLDAKSGVKLVVSQDEKGLKSMLVNQKKGMPLAMDCYSNDVASSVF